MTVYAKVQQAKSDHSKTSDDEADEQQTEHPKTTALHDETTFSSTKETDAKIHPKPMNNHVTLYDYWSLLQRCPDFRYYFISATCMHVGDWFVEIASLLVVEELVDESNRGKALGSLVVWSMLPKPIFAPIGGIMADTFDRKRLMIVLDMTSGIIVLAFLVAIAKESLTGVLLITGIRSSLESMYYPATTGILPLLVSNARDLQLAATMNAFAWSLMAVVGGVLAGTASAIIGLQACYIVDSVTYLISAVVIYFGLRGNTYSAPRVKLSSQQLTMRNNASCTMFSHVWTTVSTLFVYLYKSGFGWNTFLKPSANAIWAPESIIGMAFSNVEGNDENSSFRMGIVFSTLGVGCLVGPILANYTGLADAQRPRTLQQAVIVAMVLSTVSWMAIATIARSYGMFVVLTFFRTMGSGIAWVNGTLILQTLSDPSMLGRVLAVEYAISNLVHALIAHWTGQLEDYGLDKHGLAWFSAGVGFVMVIMWSGYHYGCQGGAARPQFNGVKWVDRIEMNEHPDEVPENDAHKGEDHFQDEPVAGTSPSTFEHN